MLTFLSKMFSFGTDVEEEPVNAVEATAKMANDPAVRKMAAAHHLDVLNVTWEDTGRTAGSCYGDNISDMTLCVKDEKSAARGDIWYGDNMTAMPVFRAPNFSDKTGDVSFDKFHIMTGNHDGSDLKKTSLRTVLGDVGSYLSEKVAGLSLLRKDDTHVLVSPQSCFLPVPANGLTKFYPKLYNYQSRAGHPAVLTILCTREGTSITIAGREGDKNLLYHNEKGQRAPFTAGREGVYVAEKKADIAKVAKTDEKKAKAMEQTLQASMKTLNFVMVIQVPLKVKRTTLGFGGGGGFLGMDEGTPKGAKASSGYFGMATAAAAAAPQSMESWEDAPVVYRGGSPSPTRSRRRERCDRESNVERAVIGHGKADQGKFKELDGLKIQRDEKLPVRATLQFYEATSNGIITPLQVAGLASCINEVYTNADNVGSMVVPDESPGSIVNRPTANLH